MSGETEQAKGRQGALLAKQWLDRSTRVRAELVNPDGVAKKKLSLKKAHFKDANATFSFDLGGRFREGDFDGEQFLAEVKNYANSSDLPQHFRGFLAHCYRAVAIDHMMADQFFWISFAPHGGTRWDKITSVDDIKDAVLHKDFVDVNFTPGQDCEKEFSPEIAETVSKRVWLLILSPQQIEHLTLTQKHHGVLEDYIVNSAKEVEL
ncbi:hypothetical protein [Mycolicibacterium fluoranthenivorans]|uniref:Uncharacterized protein n=1 Tax=Mycolicibacterium fluoranthenivorans TaxID=258505 RepID=A0A7X5ZFP9_9MYCO|nr:hypothetical protein [Mycolicibacterium fluoranthenivorans]NIH98410.1 hypothetical protein [Mycolicibacterium fluoranthenivorans]